MQLLKAIRIAWDFFEPSLLYALSKGKWAKAIHPKSDFRWLWQAAHFSTKKTMNKPATNNLRILLAAVFHFYLQWKKTVKNITWLHKTMSVSAISKQGSRCCNMLYKFLTHELTCQILTNQSVKTGRRAWPTRDHREKGQKQLSCL